MFFLVAAVVVQEARLLDLLLVQILLRECHGNTLVDLVVAIQSNDTVVQQL